MECAPRFFFLSFELNVKVLQDSVTGILHFLLYKTFQTVHYIQIKSESKLQ